MDTLINVKVFTCRLRLSWISFSLFKRENAHVSFIVDQRLIKSHFFLSFHIWILLITEHVNFLVDGCPTGYTGKYCETACSFPRYGYGCQHFCLCSKHLCDVSIGCLSNQIGKFFYSKTMKQFKLILYYVPYYFCLKI